MPLAGRSYGTSLIKPHFRNLVSSGELLNSFTAEVNVEEGNAENAGPYPSMSSRHILLLKAGPSNSTKLEWTANGGRKSRLFRPGDLIINPAGLITRPRWDASVELLVLAIEPERLNQLAIQSNARAAVELVPTYGMEDQLLAHLLRAVTHEFENEAPDLLYAETMTNAVVAHLLRKYSVTPIPLSKDSGGLPKQAFRAATEYMHAHLARTITLKELASLAEISPSYFVRLFRRSAGVPPHQWLLQLRIEKAETLLRSSRLSIAEIAAQTGFADQSHLTRLFRQHRGVTPLTFRREQ